MEVFFRLTVVLGLLLALTLGVGVVQPAWLEELGMDFWNLPSLHRELQQIHRDNEAIESLFKERIQSFHSKERVICDLIEGKLTFAEAEQRIRQLSTRHELETAYIGLNLTDGTDEEKLRRLIKFWVECQLEQEPHRAAEIWLRLRSERRTNDVR